MTDQADFLQIGKLKISRQYLVLGVILLAGLVFGLIYLFLMPPWQHYDEPNHFEYAWLLSYNRRIPTQEDYDPVMSRQVVESMVNHGFYDGLGYLPDTSPGRYLDIGGFDQFDEPPLYYLMVALPLKILDTQLIEVQLYAARFVSLFLFLLTVLAAWGIVRELTSPGSPLRWLLPLSVVLLPAFTDLMTAVNNDVAAITLVSLFLWVAVRMIKRGVSIWRLLLLTLLAALSVVTKATAMMIIPLWLFVVVLSIVRGKYRWIVWAGLALFIVIGLAVAISWGDAAYWTRSTFQAENTRVTTDLAPVGDYALQFVLEPGASSPYNHFIRQALPLSIGKSLDHQVVTVGAWVWASRPVETRSLILDTYSGGQQFSEPVSLDQNPKFVGYVANLADKTGRIFISLEPPQGEIDSPVTIFVDGIVLAQGQFPVDVGPEFSYPDGRSGIWGGKLFTNLVRNPSLEQSWPRLRPWVDKLGIRFLPDPGVNTPSVIFYTLLDWELSFDYYRGAAQRLLRTFWATFGWGHVPLLGHKPYRYLLGLTILGMIGTALLVIRRKRNLPWDIAIFLLIGLLGVWGVSLVRGSNYILIPYNIYYPVARYTYPMVIPTMLIITTGIYVLFRYLKIGLRIKSNSFYLIPLFIFLFLAIYSIVSIAYYYKIWFFA